MSKKGPLQGRNEKCCSRHSKQVREKTQRGKKIKRFLMIGAASGVGGVLIGHFCILHQAVSSSFDLRNEVH